MALGFTVLLLLGMLGTGKGVSQLCLGHCRVEGRPGLSKGDWFE